MAKIHMTSGFNLIPEGTYVFRVYDAIYVRNSEKSK